MLVFVLVKFIGNKLNHRVQVVKHNVILKVVTGSLVLPYVTSHYYAVRGGQLRMWLLNYVPWQTPSSNRNMFGYCK